MTRLTIFTLTLALFVSCQKFEETDSIAIETTASDAPKTLHAYIDEAPIDSRTYIDENLNICWSEGDEITYFPGTTAPSQYRFDGKTGAQNGNFSLVSADSGGLTLNCNYAIYPHSSTYTVTTQGVISFKMPTTQPYTEGSFAPGANIMFAKTASLEDTQLHFVNIGGYIKLQLYGENTTVKSISFCGNNDEFISGKGSITTYNNGSFYTSIGKSASSGTEAFATLSIDCGQGVKLSNDPNHPTDFWLVVPPTTFKNGFSITVADTEGRMFKKSTPNAVTIKRNTIQPMKAIKVTCDEPALNNKIFYTATTKIEPTADDIFGARIVSNEWSDKSGEGVITFDSDVTRIGTKAFYAKHGLISIILPNSVTKIDDHAFRLSDISEITIPESVVSIGNYTFAQCDYLTRVEIPDSVTSIGEYALYHCSRIKDITLSNNLTTIEKGTFEGCEALQSIVIPEGITTIKNSAFYYCGCLSDIKIPDSVTSIGENVFDYCSALPVIENLIYADTYLVGVDSKQSSYTVREGTRFIGHLAFLDCDSTTSIILPESVISIGIRAFDYCSSLTNINIPKGLISIGYGAFYNCSSLTIEDLVLENIITIGEAAFQDCNITSITIGNNAISIGHDAFSNAKLTHINLGESVRTIGNQAFSDCDGLTNISIPNSVTSIGDRAFSWCDGLTNITIPGNVKSLGSSVFLRCSSLKSAIIGDGITSLDGTFNECQALTNVVLPNSLTTIGGSVFYNCYQLQNIEIPNSVKTIGSQAFASCKSLTKLDIPNSVTKIERSAFVACNGLISISIPQTISPIEIAYDAFDGCTGELKIDNKLIEESYTSKNYPFKYNRFTKIVIGENITHLGGYIFYNSSSLVDVVIPSNVTSIGSAFSGCTAIKNVELNKGLTTIGESAFSGCSSLEEITIPESVTAIQRNAFYKCTSLKEIYCKPTTPPSIGRTMIDRSSLQYIYVPRASLNSYKSNSSWRSEYSSYLVGYDF